MKIKIAEIAHLANVSSATVSRIINGSSDVSKEKRDAVLQIFEKLHYTPKKKHSRTFFQKIIGILFFDDSYTDSGVILKKFRQIMKRLPDNWQIQLLSADVSPLFLSSLYRKDLLSGLIVVGHNSNDPEMDDVLETIPSVFLNSHSLKNKTVLLNGNDAAGKLAAQYLMDKKCKNFFLLHAPSLNPGVRARIDGFRFACFCENKLYTSCEIPMKEKSAFQEKTSSSELEYNLEKALEIVDLTVYDGIFVPEARLMALLCRYFLKHKIAQPVMIACNTGEEYFSALYPRPAYINLGENTIVALAVEQLIQKISNPEVLQQTSVLITPELIPGDEQ